MRISVIGCGYLGAVHAVSMAKLGHDVIGVDVDAGKIAALQSGKAPFFEPGLPEILEEARSAGRIRFTTDIAEVKGAQVHFLGVGTPQGAEGAANLEYVNAAFASLVPYLGDEDIIAGKSTVPVGTAERLAEELAATGSTATLVWNPEFLREGFAVQDTIAPDRIVYGVPAGERGARAAAVLDQVYVTALEEQTPRLVVDYATAELVKVSANAFLATKISFINAMAEVAEATGADVTALADAIGYDARIGRRFLNAGLGFGGGCLPKDIRAFQARAREIGLEHTLDFLADVDAVNLRRRDRVIDLSAEMLGGDVSNRTIAVLGLAFKPDSDDIRDSPALAVATRLMAAGANVVAYDPEAMATAQRAHPDLHCASSAEEALRGAELVLVLTEWKQFRDLDPVAVGSLVDEKRVIDGRNCLDASGWLDAGFDYRGMGRLAVPSEDR